MPETILEKPKEYHPLVRLVLENPLVSFNVMAFIFVGGTGYAAMMTQISGMERQISEVKSELARVERSGTDISTGSNVRFEKINSELTDLKVTLRGVSTSLEFLVQQERRRAQ
jgi:hypothetical protein